MVHSEPLPKISVIMPVWNGDAYLASAIDSILTQTWADFEFLILDDGSTDRSREILADYAEKDSRIRVIQLEHEGIVIALNRGVAEAKAEWIARMDCDDIAHQDRLKHQWNAIQQNTNAVLCHTQIRLIGDPDLIVPAGRFIRSKALLALRLCFQCPIVHPTVMFSKAAFVKCGGYMPEERHAEDYGLWGRLLMIGDIIGCAEPLLDYRVHSDSISKKMANTQKVITEKIAIRHCENFMNLDASSASIAYKTFWLDAPGNPQKNWLKLLLHCFPRMRWQSIEMWAWIVSRSIQIAKLTICSNHKF